MVTPQEDDMRMRRIAAARGSTKCSVRGCPVEIWDGRDTCRFHEKETHG
jgi:hypothetical protein